MIKKLILVILILLIIGLYFVPGLTRDVISSTGKSAMDFTKKITGKIVGSEAVQNTKDSAKARLSESLSIKNTS